MPIGRSFSWDKFLEESINNPTSSSDEKKSKWRYTSIPAVRHHTAQKDKFTSLLN
jgi:hypothetical protein